jgi:type IV secretion system protein VirB11
MITEQIKNYIIELTSRGQIPNIDWLKEKFELSLQDDSYNWLVQIIDFCEIKKLIEQNFREIIIHSTNHVQVFTNNEVNTEKLSMNMDDFLLSLKILALKNNIDWNYKSPSPSFTILFNQMKLRITLLHPSMSPNNTPKLFIRNLSQEVVELSKFQIPNEQIDFVKKLISEGKNIIISGATGSGKTTFMSSLIHILPVEHHAIILEDTEEIHTQNLNHTRMLTQVNGFSLKDYLTFGLRMTPERIIVGEIRSDEIVPFILAINTGHNGVMSTIHANSAIDSIHRLALLFQLYSGIKDLNYQTILKLITRNIDYVIHLNKRKITEIVQVIGSEDHNCFIDKIYEAS